MLSEIGIMELNSDKRVNVGLRWTSCGNAQR